MSDVFPELDRARVVVDETTRSRHLTAIQGALARRSRRPHRGMRSLALGLALVVAVPVLALAAEDTVPGDFLYPLKRVTEPLVRLIDADVSMKRRVEELETLLARDAPEPVIRDHMDVARDTVSEGHPWLIHRIDRVAEELEERRTESDRPSPTDRPATGSTTTTATPTTNATVTETTDRTDASDTTTPRRDG